MPRDEGRPSIVSRTLPWSIQNHSHITKVYLFIMSVYSTGKEPKNHIEQLRSTNRSVPSKPSYGMDSPLGLLASSVLSPLYLYASLKGKFDVWDKLLAELPTGTLSSPALDIGCGRGLVLLKIAQRKKLLSANTGSHHVNPVYGVDLFIKADQSGNSAESTYDNAASLDLLDQVVLHTVDFTQLPFQNETMALVTASLSIHNADKPSRKKAISEAERVLQPGGFLIILELAGYVSEYKEELKAAGWTDLNTEFGGLEVMFGGWPCQILRGRKPNLLDR